MSDFLREYIKEIEVGRIRAGTELKQELYRLKADIESEKYIYDTTEAERRIDFMENCVRLTKSPYYNKPMRLMLWQKAFIETVYSFRMPSGERRFKRVLLLIARKNCKSETCSALGLTELFLGQEGEDIVCASNDESQASIIYDAIDTMRVLIDPDGLDSKRNQRFILNLANNSKIFKMSDRTKNKEGRNIDVAFLDEAHEMKENIIAKSLEQSQSLKDEPLFIILTTEGFVVDGYLDEEIKRARKIIAGEEDGAAAERYLPWLYTQDSEAEVWQDRSSWTKSNPSLGIVKRWDYLDEQIDIAKSSKADRIFALCKDFNIKQSSSAAWLTLDDYDYPATYEIEGFKGCYALGAADMSETTDLTCAKVLLMKPDEDVKYIHTMYFIPESKLEESDDRLAGAKYKEWAQQGLITLSEGNDIDLSLVADWFYGLYEKYSIRLWRCGYDQKFSRDFLNRMEYYGWGKGSDVILIPQNAQTLSNAMKLLEADLKHRKVNYNENPIDKWCLGNAAIKVNDLGQCLAVKREVQKRIDGAVTDIILYEVYRQNRAEFRQMIGGVK